VAQVGHYELVDVDEYNGRGILETEKKHPTHDKILPEFLSCCSLLLVSNALMSNIMSNEAQTRLVSRHSDHWQSRNHPSS
jgi:hypothetical protein